MLNAYGGFCVRLLAVFALLQMFYGCDRVETVKQKIKLRIDTEEDRSLVDIGIRIRPSWESWRPELYGEDEKPKYKKKWENSRWFVGKTNSNGETAIVVSETSLDTGVPRTTGLFGCKYQVEIRSGSKIETIEMVMNQGAATIVGPFELSVMSISELH